MIKTYAEKLKDPRWQKKRLQIFERDNWSCQMCQRTKETLVVHHRLYLPEAEAWEYEDRFLVTLCERCHQREREYRPRFEEHIKFLLQLHFSCLDLANLLLVLDTNRREDLRQILADWATEISNS